MQAVAGTVVGGHVVVQGVALPEGTRVTVLTRGADESFALSVDEEDDLIDALAEIERGDVVSLEQLLATLPNRT
jgi:hypothetical protein